MWFGQAKFLVYTKTILGAVNATFQVFMCYVIHERSWIIEESRGVNTPQLFQYSGSFHWLLVSVIGFHTKS